MDDNVPVRGRPSNGEKEEGGKTSHAKKSATLFTTKIKRVSRLRIAAAVRSED